MINWVYRILWFVAGIVTGWFVSEDALNFGVIQMVVTLLLITGVVALIAFWPARWTAIFNQKRERR